MTDVTFYAQKIEGCFVTHEHTREDGSKVNVVVGQVMTIEEDGKVGMSLDKERLKKLGVDLDGKHTNVSMEIY